MKRVLPFFFVPLRRLLESHGTVYGKNQDDYLTVAPHGDIEDAVKDIQENLSRLEQAPVGIHSSPGIIIVGDIVNFFDKENHVKVETFAEEIF